MASDPITPPPRLTVIARRDDGALLAQLDDDERAVLIDSDGTTMWVTTIGSALGRGNWNEASDKLADLQTARALREIQHAVPVIAPGTA